MGFGKKGMGFEVLDYRNWGLDIWVMVFEALVVERDSNLVMGMGLEVLHNECRIGGLGS